jgi:hypothetical protein
LTSDSGFSTRGISLLAYIRVKVSEALQEFPIAFPDDFIELFF